MKKGFVFFVSVILLLLIEQQVFAQGFFGGAENSQERLFNNKNLDPQVSSDSLTALAQKDSLENAEKEPQYVMRNFDHKEQVITAGAFMASIIFIVTSTNNFNPKR